MDGRHFKNFDVPNVLHLGISFCNGRTFVCGGIHKMSCENLMIILEEKCDLTNKTNLLKVLAYFLIRHSKPNYDLEKFVRRFVNINHDEKNYNL